VQHVLQLLAQARWQVKQSKCSFAINSVDYLGHVISASGVSTDPSKIKVIKQWPNPKNIKQLRSFLGLAGSYRKFVRNFRVICKPLIELLKKNIVFSWTSHHDYAFTALKLTLVSAPVLVLPNYAKPFQLETDAGDTGIGDVLLQDNHPLAFVNKALGPRTRGLSTYEKEYLAILMAVDHWRPYLQLAEFIIFTNQKSLTHLEEQKLHTSWQQKFFTKMMTGL
jgi:hypothetical protein